MKLKHDSKSSVGKRRSWRTLIAVVAVTLLLVGIVAAINRQEPQILKAENPNALEQKRNKYFVTSNPAGETVLLNRETGQSRPLSQQEQQTLAAGIKQLINQSTDGLVQINRADGSVSMDLEGHFQNVLVAKKEADGSVTQSCVNDLETAANFFEIDPALLGIAARPQGKALSAKPEIR